MGTKPVSDRWLRVHDYLTTNKIRGSFGIITESLEKDNALYFQWLKDVHAAGQIEFWMHGYHMKNAKEPGEFEQGTAAEQTGDPGEGRALCRGRSWGLNYQPLAHTGAARPMPQTRRWRQCRV